MNTRDGYLDIVTENFRSMKKQAESAIEQLTLEELHAAPNEESNSIATLIKHMSGNLKSRFTDFLTSDGEKPERKRDEEFISAFKTKEELQENWSNGWDVLFQTLGELKEEDLAKTVSIRAEPYSVISAIQRSVVHQSGHVGQIVYIAKMIKNEKWKTLSIPKGNSEEFTKRMAEQYKK